MDKTWKAAKVEMEFSPRMVFLVVLLLIGLLVLFFNAISPAISTGGVDTHLMFFPLVFR